MRFRRVLPVLICALLAAHALAADRFSGFNETASTEFTGVYLAPRGTSQWGPNQALNDKDKSWEPGERLQVKGASRDVFDLKVVDRAGHVCIKHGIDLTNDTTFDIRDADLNGCKQ